MHDASRPARRISDERGFTLIELLIVVAIIGVLAGIGFSSLVYARVRGYNAQAKSALHNAVLAEEALFASDSVYASCADQDACAAALPGYIVTPDVALEFTSGAPNEYVGTASHPKGDAVFTFDSTLGVLVETPIP